MTRRLLLPLAVIAVTNLALLYSERWNRSDTPEAVVRLTERELQLPYMQSERNSAAELELTIGRDPGDGTWLSAAKLESLGFDAGSYRPQLSRQGFGVYEYEGPAWTRHVRRLEAQRASLVARSGDQVMSQIAQIDRQMRLESRLFEVDGSQDPVALRTKYPDRTRYVILPVTMYVFSEGRMIGGATQRFTTGATRLVATTLVVPVQLRGPLDRAAAGGRFAVSPFRPPRAGPTGPRYAVTVAIGRRYEPWITAVVDIDTTPTSH